jgi:MFS family permease
MERGAAPGELQALWSNRDFALLTGGRIVSTLGSDVSALAFPLLIYGLTRSAFQMGVLAALRFVPYLLLSLPAGALVDRWDRKRVMIVCDAGRALAMGSIPAALALNRLGIWQLYLVTVIEGAFFVFFNLAQTACLPRVVSERQLRAATAQNYVADSLADLVGPALGGALYTAARQLPFLADAVSYVISVLAVRSVRVSFGDPAATPGRLVDEIREGVRWLWRQSLVRFLAVLTSCTDCVMAGLSLVVIVVAQAGHASAAAIGLILAAGSVGGMVAAVVAPRLRARHGFTRVALGSLWALAAVFPLYALAHAAWQLALVTACAFAVYALYDIIQFSERMALIPDALQGRVNSIFRLLVFVGIPVGQVVKGALLQSLGPSRTVLLFWVPLVVLVALATIALHTPHLRDATKRASLQAGQPGQEAGEARLAAPFESPTPDSRLG